MVEGILCTKNITAEKITAILGNKPTEAVMVVQDKSQTAEQSKQLLKELTAILN